MSTTERLESDYAALAGQLKALKSDLAGISSALVEIGQTQRQQAVESMKHQAETLRQRGVEEYAHLRDQAGETMAKADAFVKDRPATAVGIAAGLGFVLGMLLAPSYRRH